MGFVTFRALICPMYRLEVFHPGEIVPHASEGALSAADVMTRIPELLREFGDCERIVVSANSRRLFAVDCAGNRIEL